MSILNILPEIVQFPALTRFGWVTALWIASLPSENLGCKKKKKTTTTLARGTLLVGLKMFIQSAALAALRSSLA